MDKKSDSPPDSFFAETAAPAFAIVVEHQEDPDQPAFRFTEVNQAFSDALHIPLPYIENRLVSEALPITLRGDFIHSLQEAILKKSPLTQRICYRFDGGALWFLLTLSLAPAPTPSSPTRILGICLNISPRVRSEQVLLEANTIERQLTLALDQIEDPIVIARKENDSFWIIYSNASFRQRTGYTTGELLARDPFYLLFQKPSIHFQPWIEKLEQTPAPVIHHSTLQLRNGTEEPYWFSLEEKSESDLGIPGLQIRLLAPKSENTPPPTSKLDKKSHANERLQALTHTTHSLTRDFQSLLTALLANLPLIESSEETSRPIALRTIRLARQAVQSASDFILSLIAPDSLESKKLPTEPPPELSDEDILYSAPTHLEQVLILEPDSMTSQVMEEALRQLNIIPLTATHAADALQLLSATEHPPQIIIVDAKLPDASGIEFIRQCRKKEIQSRYLLVTPFLKEEDAIELKDEKIDSLYKPFDISQFLRAVHHKMNTSLNLTS